MNLRHRSPASTRRSQPKARHRVAARRNLQGRAGSRTSLLFLGADAEILNTPAACPCGWIRIEPHPSSSNRSGHHVIGAGQGRSRFWLAILPGCTSRVKGCQRTQHYRLQLSQTSGSRPPTWVPIRGVSRSQIIASLMRSRDPQLSETILARSSAEETPDRIAAHDPVQNHVRFWLGMTLTIATASLHTLARSFDL